MAKKKTVKKNIPKETKTKEKKVGKFLYWTPRILAIIFVLFLMLFSLDVFEPGLTAWQIIIGLFMHNIPAFVLLAIVIISWKHELVGAIGFTLAGILYIALLLLKPKFEWYMLSWSLIIAGPAIAVGILFYINWLKKKK
jgi:hypothetical protein